MLSTVLKWSSRAATRASPTCAASATRCAAYHRHQSTSATTSPSSPSVSPPAYIPPPPAAEISYTARAAVDRLRDGAPANDLSRFINFTMDTGDKRAIVEEHVRGSVCQCVSVSVRRVVCAARPPTRTCCVRVNDSPHTTTIRRPPFTSPSHEPRSRRALPHGRHHAHACARSGWQEAGCKDGARAVARGRTAWQGLCVSLVAYVECGCVF